jgi:hypothetical protein
VPYGVVQQRSKCGLTYLLEGGEFQAPHGEPARNLPASGGGEQTCGVGKLTAVVEAECEVLLEGNQVGELLAELLRPGAPSDRALLGPNHFDRLWQDLVDQATDRVCKLLDFWRSTRDDLSECAVVFGPVVVDDSG